MPFFKGYTLPHFEHVNKSPLRARFTLQLGQKGEESCMNMILWHQLSPCQTESPQFCCS